MESLVLTSFGLLSFAALIVRKFTGSSNSIKNEASTAKEEESKESKFRKLQWKFFSAYFLAILGDWLQGPYIYKVRTVIKNCQIY